ncbi:hypothetical protein Plim_1712 [Planctopirus limnophila DSM 3776]|uniref:Uncharacterized protein n=1 Tax=Planctopirus limnophila (strain ATCC 43296 / DSM 3776 / IFAM 1008 / Mu 290) TaxID=521674 RepID=D5SXH5_PLAL2|nr:hypothetical protein Plim_1712 [Planctopirus limnophila DSM 3776]
MNLNHSYLLKISAEVVESSEDKSMSKNVLTPAWCVLHSCLNSQSGVSLLIFSEVDLLAGLSL